MSSPFDYLPKSTLTNKPVLHFVHANGFPSKVYQPLFDIWESVFSVEYIGLFGTDEQYPPDNHWQSMTDQVIDSIEKSCQKHNVSGVVAVGHSVGAVCSLQACAKDPTHILQVVALDPSLLMGKVSFGYQMSKITDNLLKPLPKLHHYFVDKISPASKSKYRKEHFASRQLAYDNLRNKGLFKNFDERTFNLYIENGFVPSSQGFSLAISKETELAIFRTIPSLYWAKKLSIFRPTTIICGQDSHFTKMGSYDKIAKKWGVTIKAMPGSHMFVLEFPENVANEVLETIYSQIKPPKTT